MKTISPKATEKYIRINKAQERYLQIYHEYYVLNWSWWEIAEYHGCTKMTVNHALGWVDKNKLRIPSKSLIAGAISAVKLRLKNLIALYEVELKKKRPDHKSVTLLNKEIREDEKMLYQLQNIFTEKYDIEVTTSSADILKLINTAAKQVKKEDASKKTKTIGNKSN